MKTVKATKPLIKKSEPVDEQAELQKAFELMQKNKLDRQNAAKQEYDAFISTWSQKWGVQLTPVNMIVAQ